MASQASSQSSTKRREFLRFLAASPLAAAWGNSAWAQQTSPAVYRAVDALSVSDFEALTRGMLPPAHLGYLISGVDDDATLKLNREGFQHFQLRARRLVVWREARRQRKNRRGLAIIALCV